MSHSDDITILWDEIARLRQLVDMHEEDLSKLRRRIVGLETAPSLVDAMIDGPAGIQTHELTATEAAMQQRIRRRARLYRKEDDQ